MYFDGWKYTYAQKTTLNPDLEKHISYWMITKLLDISKWSDLDVR